MKELNRKRVWDLGMTAIALLVIVTMIVPVTPVIMDILIALNFAVGALIFSASMLFANPVKFSVFPSLLLLSTLYRLALNISSTRLILTNGNAGKIIGGFGGFVVGGDIIVGAIIFIIITMVLFLVITKGAERVAEVSARFTLDAMPGIQSAIQSELQSGSISPREIAYKREDLEKKSMFYGSLDGAMKFVKGDAVVALIITTINITGGTIIGVIRNNMSVTDAFNFYGRLTIGDGIVTMMPALLITTAAGMLVTRLGQGGNISQLGSQIARQVFSEPLALLATAAMMLLLSIVPGLPFWPFLIMAVLLGVSYFAANKILIGNQNPEPGKSLSHDKFLITLDKLQQLLDGCAKENPVLVRESVYGRVSLSYLADILTEMKLDGIDESYLVQILEALSREEITDDLDDMLIRLRLRLGGSLNDISKQIDGLKIIEVDSLTEDLLLENCIKTARGKELILNTDVTNLIIEKINHSFDKSKTTSLLTGTFIRRPLARLLQSHISQISVFAKGELIDYDKIEIVDSLSIDI